MKTLTIKHKLWGKLKRKANDSYKIVPAKESERYFIFYEEWNDHGTFTHTLEEAIDEVEYLRTVKFQRLCYEVLYERRKKKVKDL